MDHRDENLSPNAKKEKTLVSKMRARFEVETRGEPAPANQTRARKMESALKPKSGTPRTSSSPEDGPELCSPRKRILEDCASAVKEPRTPGFKKYRGQGARAGEWDTVLTVIRFRPYGPGDGDTGERSAYAEDGTVVVKTSDKKDAVYGFDDVCPEDVSQEAMFDRAGKKMADAFLDGFNSTIFAYGQTGSGKTHTMQGQLNLDSPTRGLMPRVFSYIFQQLHEEGSSFELKVSFLQIYNEKIQDLLNPFVNTKIEHVEGDLKLREGQDGVFVEGLTKTTCSSAEEALNCVVKGVKNRKVGKTAMNTESSRSHSILTVYLSTAKHYSRLNLIDLAGSENQKTATASSAAQQREANNINTSLTFLGQCLRDAAKGQGASHVNYRNSKLTMMLKDSLGGNSRTCLIATVSALPVYAIETMSTLKFASAIKFIQTQAVRNFTRVSSVSTFEVENAQLRESVRTLQLEVQAKETQAEQHEASVRSLEIERAELIQSKHEEADKARALQEEVQQLRALLATQAERSTTESETTVANLQKALLVAQRERDESKRALEAAETEKAKMLEENAETKEDLRFMIEKEATLQARVAELEQAFAGGTIRAVSERGASSPAEQLAALQREVLRLQENSLRDMARIDELRALNEQLQQEPDSDQLQQAHTRAAQLMKERGTSEPAAFETVNLRAMLEDLKKENSQLNADLRAVLCSRKILRESIGQSIELCAKLYWSQGKLMGGLDEREALKAELTAKGAEAGQLKEKIKSLNVEITKYKTERAASAQQLRDGKTLKLELSKLKTKNAELEEQRQRLLGQVQQLEDQLRRERSEQDQLCQFAKNSEGEKQRALLTKIEADFGGKLPLDNRTRLFLKSGVLNRVSRDKKLLEYNFFLFSDVLIYATASPKGNTPLGKEKFKLHRVMHLGLCRVVDIQPDPSKDFGTQWSHSFKLISPQKSFTISCDTHADKENWLRTIVTQIEKVYAQPEGISVQVPRVADVSLIDSKMPFDSGLASAEPSVSIHDSQAHTRHPSISLMEGEIEAVCGWPDDMTRTRDGSGGSISERSRAPSLSSAVSRVTDFTPADMPTTETEQMRAKLQASSFCKLCIHPFSIMRRKAVCGCCGTQDVCKDCCSKKAVPPRKPELKEQRVCLACYGGITRLVGHAIPRLQTAYGDA